MSLNEISLNQILNLSNASRIRLYEILTAEVKKQHAETKEPTALDTSDSLGQLVYLIVVIVLYSLGALCVLISRVKPNAKHVQPYSTAKNAHHFFNQMRDQSLLEQLRDQEYRKRVWSIYRKDSDGQNRRGSNFYIKNEETILKSINKKLDTIQKEKDTAFEMRHIGFHVHKSIDMTHNNRAQMNKILSEWSTAIKFKANKKQKDSEKKIVRITEPKRVEVEEEESSYYYTIAGSSFHNKKAEQYRQSILSTFPSQTPHANIIVSNSMPFLNETNTTPTPLLQHQRFSVDNV